jgi:VCBS repeat-containing protein
VGGPNSVGGLFWGDVDYAPVAEGHSRSPGEGEYLDGSVTAVDPNEKPLTYTLMDDVTDGTLVFNTDGSYEYTAPTTAQTQSFTYMVNDGTKDSNVATVTITVRNIAPVAIDETVTVPEDGVWTGALAGTDDAWDLPLTFGPTGTTATSIGSVEIATDGTFTYEPDPDTCGADSFGFTIADEAATDTGTITIDVTCVNDAPVADPA